MGVKKFRRTRVHLEQSQLRLRVIFLILSALTIASGLLLAVIVFFYLLSFILEPGNLQSLVDDWSALLIEKTQNNDSIISATEGPARWFAIVVLLVLGFLASRIPLLLIQMGTLLFNASQDHSRQTKEILKDVLLELRHHNAPLPNAASREVAPLPPPAEQTPLTSHQHPPSPSEE